MKKTMKFLSMAALALVGAVMTGCSNDEDGFTDTPQQPAATNYSVTKTLRVSLDGGEAGARGITRALSEGGTKTFATGDKLAIIYMNEGGTMTKVETEELKAGDISLDGQTATFTVTFTEAPKTSGHGGSLSYVYPASIATDDGNVDNSQLNSQDGTFATLASNLDACRKSIPEWDGGDLPALTLTNAFTIGKFIIKNPSGTAINDELTSVTISDGANTYTITPTGSTFTSDPIWVAMQPIWEGSTVTVTATDGTNNYSKSITIASGKGLLAGKIYPINVTTVLVWDGDLAKITSESTEAFATATDGMTITGTLTVNKKISIAAGATVTLNDATINGTNDESYKWAGITCLGNATIILSGTNTMKGFCEDYPGVQAGPTGTTLTIQGSGSLTASPYDGGGIGSYAAGIGCAWGIDCGNIVIEGGTISATGGSEIGAGIGSTANSTCGNIEIKGGEVTAESVAYSAGIGSSMDGGYTSSCGNITITSGVTRVTATKGFNAPNSIGAGLDATCGTVTIGGTVYWGPTAADPSEFEYKNGGDTYLPTSPLVYPAP